MMEIMIWILAGLSIVAVALGIYAVILNLKPLT